MGGHGKRSRRLTDGNPLVGGGGEGGTFSTPAYFRLFMARIPVFFFLLCFVLHKNLYVRYNSTILLFVVRVFCVFVAGFANFKLDV